MSTVSTTHDHAHDHAHDDHTPHGWRRWLFATNHKDIGTMYLIFSFCMLLEGGTLALLLRTELFEPGIQFFQPCQQDRRLDRTGCWKRLVRLQLGVAAVIEHQQIAAGLKVLVNGRQLRPLLAEGREFRARFEASQVEAPLQRLQRRRAGRQQLRHGG